jgi:NAD(P)-dependent dehydrogenase (short-subunit alcohol dehydrogenase family)
VRVEARKNEGEGELTSYFVTGATGFIGRHLVARLVEREGTIHVLVREGSRARLEELTSSLATGEGRIVPMIGDIGAPLLGVSEEDREKLRRVDHFFHLAAVYDMTADEEANRRANVEGTRNAVALANELGARRFHHVSSIAVAGRYRGLFLENMFDEGQEFGDPYSRTKFESEKLAREELGVPWRVYRPGIVVGHSETGEMDKIDGPYYFFKVIQRARRAFPQWMPIVGLEGGRINVVPVDFVARAMDHIGHLEGLDGRAFHLTDPNPKSAGHVMNVFARAAHAPEFGIRLDRQIIEVVPRQVRKMIAQLPPVKRITDQVLADFGIPRETLSYVDYPTDYDSRDARGALADSGIAVPALEAYADRLWDYWERNLDPDLFKDRSLRGAIEGKVVVITGASSGIGHVTALEVGAAGGVAVLVARSAEKLEETKSEIEEAGGTAAVHPADLSDLDDCDRVVEEILDTHGRVDVLVNNAGRSIRRAVENQYERFHDFERTMQVNYFGSLKLILAFLPGMRARKAGHIINVSSIGAQTNTPRFSAYVASKSALDAFSRCVASELVDDHVQITTIYMPLVRTPMIEPTKMYEYFPTISPDEAAALITGAMISRPKKVATRLGTFGEVLYAVAPKAVDVILNTGYKLFPETAAARGKKEEREETPSSEGIAFAHLMRGVHW